MRKLARQGSSYVSRLSVSFGYSLVHYFAFCASALPLKTYRRKGVEVNISEVKVVLTVQGQIRCKNWSSVFLLFRFLLSSSSSISFFFSYVIYSPLNVNIVYFFSFSLCLHASVLLSTSSASLLLHFLPSLHCILLFFHLTIFHCRLLYFCRIPLPLLPLLHFLLLFSRLNPTHSVVHN